MTSTTDSTGAAGILPEQTKTDRDRLRRAIENAEVIGFQANPSDDEPSKIDPVVAVGIEIGRVARTIETLEELGRAARRDKASCGVHYFDTAQRNADDHIGHARVMLSHRKATTLEGAAIQLAQAGSVADLILDMLPKEAETYRIKEAFRSLQRLLFSSLHVVNDQAERKVQDIVSAEFPNFHMDPWQTPEQLIVRVAAIDADKDGAS